MLTYLGWPWFVPRVAYEAMKRERDAANVGHSEALNKSFDYLYKMNTAIQERDQVRSKVNSLNTFGQDLQRQLDGAMRTMKELNDCCDEYCKERDAIQAKYDTLCQAITDAALLANEDDDDCGLTPERFSDLKEPTNGQS